MNKNENHKLDILTQDIKQIGKTVEKIVTNDLPHMNGKIERIIGKLSVLVPLIIGLLGVIIAIALKVLEVY